MPYIKKPPEVVSRTLKLEQPVSELLDDYSRFVECSPDHVTNFVLKKLLWRDPGITLVALQEEGRAKPRPPSIQQR